MTMPRASCLSAAVLAFTCASCRILGLVQGEPCDDDGDCATDVRCLDGICEGTAEGEGEGREGEGEGEGQEGEGEGEGQEGEGEGEGEEGEGEGESQGDPNAPGDPNLLDVAIVGGAPCSQIGSAAFSRSTPQSAPSIAWTPAAAGADAGECVLEFTNRKEASIQVDTVTVSGSNFAFVSTSPGVPFEVGVDQVLSVTVRATAPASAATANGTLRLVGQRTRAMALFSDARAADATPTVVMHADRGCHDFGGVDRVIGEMCTFTVVNVTDSAPVTLESATLSSPDFTFITALAAPVELAASATYALSVRALPGSAGARSGTLTVTSSANVVDAALSAVLADPAPQIVDTPDCTFTTANGNVSRGACTFIEQDFVDLPAQRNTLIRNDGTTTLVIVDAFRDDDSKFQPLVELTFDELLPFILAPGELRDLGITATAFPIAPGDWGSTVQFYDETGQAGFELYMSGRINEP